MGWTQGVRGQVSRDGLVVSSEGRRRRVRGGCVDVVVVVRAKAAKRASMCRCMLLSSGFLLVVG